MDVAQAVRSTYFKENEPIDPEVLMDELCEQTPGFDWFVGNVHFEQMTDVVAYAKFDDGRHIYLKDEVYDALEAPGTQKFARASFIVCHEIAHTILHHRAKKPLARNKLGSKENYANDEISEREANLFAGSLMIPSTKLDLGLSESTLAKYYRTSYSVAASCKRHAEFYLAHNRKRKS